MDAFDKTEKDFYEPSHSMSSDPNLPPNLSKDPLPPVDPITNVPLASDQTTSLGLTPNLEATLSVVGWFVTGAIFFVLEKRNQFVRFWALQAILFGAVYLIVAAVIQVVGFTIGPIPLIGWLWWTVVARLCYLAMFVVWVVMLVKAFSGKVWEMPVIGKVAREQLAKSGPL